AAAPIGFSSAGTRIPRSAPSRALSQPRGRGLARARGRITDRAPPALKLTAFCELAARAASCCRRGFLICAHCRTTREFPSAYFPVLIGRGEAEANAHGLMLPLAPFEETDHAQNAVFPQPRQRSGHVHRSRRDDRSSADHLGQQVYLRAGQVHCASTEWA